MGGEKVTLAKDDQELLERALMASTEKLYDLEAAPAEMPGLEEIARLLFERGRGVHDAASWEEAGDEMREWLRGHARAVLALFAKILAEKQKPTVALNHWKSRALAAEAALAGERERCAKVAEDHGELVSNEPIGKACSRNIAAAIRAGE